MLQEDELRDAVLLVFANKQVGFCPARLCVDTSMFYSLGKEFPFYREQVFPMNSFKRQISYRSMSLIKPLGWPISQSLVTHRKISMSRDIDKREYLMISRDNFCSFCI